MSFTETSRNRIGKKN